MNVSAMAGMTEEELRTFLMNHAGLQAKFPNWTSTVNISVLMDMLRRDERQQVGNITEEDLAEFDRLDDVAEQIKRNYLWAIVALGLPGNVASLLTFWHMRSFGSCVVYVGVLAVVDSLALMEKLLLSLMLQHNSTFTPGSCKFLMYLANALVVYANWVVVALAAERLAAVCRPLAVSVYWTRSRAMALLGALLVACLLACAPVTVVAVTTKGGHSCTVNREFAEVAEAWHWANVTLYGILPCLLLLAINTTIIIRLKQARQNQQKLCHGHNRQGNAASADIAPKRGRHQTESQRQASLILLVAAFVLVLLTTPRCILIILSHFWRPTDPVLIGKLQILRQVAFALSDLNHAINFYLYFVSAKHFRTRFLDLFRSGTKGRLRRLSTKETIHHKVSDSEYMMTIRLDSVKKLDAWNGARRTQK